MVSENKRGQSAAGTAVLLAIIAGLLIMFIVLVPPQQRAELLGESQTGVTISDDESVVLEKNLLKAQPGKIDYLPMSELEHPLPVITIYTQTESKVLAEKSMAYAKRAVFTQEESKFRFSVPDLAHTNEVFLSFKIKNIQGRLILTLNGETIFNSEVEGTAPAPIILPKSSLEKENELVIGVSSPGVAFWATNEANLEELKIVAEVTSVEMQSSKNIFLISDSEKNNLEKVVLKFQPDCQMMAAGKLKVSLNGAEIYNSIPDCDLAMVPIEISPDKIKGGENEIIFSTEKGVYVLSGVKIISNLKELDYPAYYFELSEEQYQNIVDNNRKVRLRLDFVDVVESKYGHLLINGHSRGFDTKNTYYLLDISDDVVAGNNAVKIKPQKTLEVREMSVDLIK